jgi:hypothetical protein
MSQSRPHGETGLSRFGAITQHTGDFEEDTSPKILHDIKLPAPELPSQKPLPVDYLRELFTVQMGFNPDYVSTERKSGDTLYFKDQQKHIFTDAKSLEIFTQLTKDWGILPADARVSGAEVTVKGLNVQDVPTSNGETHAQVTSYSFDVKVTFELDPDDFPLLKEGTKRYKDGHRPKNPALRLLSRVGEKFDIPWLYDSRVKIDAFGEFDNAVEMRLHYDIQPPNRDQRSYTHRGSLFELNVRTSTPQRSNSELYVRSMTEHWDETEETETFRQKLIEEVHSLAGVWEDWRNRIMAIREKKSKEIMKDAIPGVVKASESSLNWDTAIVRLVAERNRQILTNEAQEEVTLELPSSST